MIKIERKETPHTQEAMDGFETITCKTRKRKSVLLRAVSGSVWLANW